MTAYQKLISEFMTMGCPTEKMASVALHAYVHLSEVKKYWDVEYHFSPELRLMYLTGKRTKSGEAEIFIPKSATEDSLFAELDQLFTVCKNGETGVVLALVSSDSTCVFYELKQGLHHPPETTRRLHAREKHDADLLRHQELILNAALCGQSIAKPP